MTKESELAALTRKREIQQSKIQLIANRLSELVEHKANRCVIEEETARLQSYLASCQEVQEDVELLVRDEEKLRCEIECWVAFESSMMDVKAKAKQYIQQHQDPELQEVKESASVGPNLPKWTLPHFSGDVLQFASFWDQFEAAVHIRTDLSNVTKMVYLQSALAGEALDAIRGFTVTNANYAVVIDILRERFGRQDAVVEAHMLSLLKLGKWERNSDGKLRELYDQLNGHVRALSAIGKDISKKELSAEDILLVMFKQRLPPHVRKRWEQKLLTDGRNCDRRMDLFFEFLRVEVEVEESSKTVPLIGCQNDGPNVNSRKATSERVKTRPDNVHPRTEKASTAAALQAVVRSHRRQLSDEKHEADTAAARKADNSAVRLSATRASGAKGRTPRHCPMCDEAHPVRFCPTFLGAPVEQRWEKCRAARLCFRCLETGHLAKNCETNKGCTHESCERDHHELLHCGVNAEGIQVGVLQSNKQAAVMLQTAQARLYGANGASMIVTCLFDAGSQRSFVCKRIADNMGLQGNTEYVSIHAFGSSVSKPTRCRRVVFSLGPASTVGCHQQMQALCVPKICSILESNGAIRESWNHVQGLDLADRFPRSRTPVDVLIGLDHYYDFITEQMKRGEAEQPVAIRSTLGWIICGRTNELTDSVSRVLNVTIEESTEMALKKLWQLDTIGITDDPVKGKDASAQLRRLQETISFDGKRYTVRLPWKAEKALPNNYRQAYQRLVCLENRVQARPEEALAYQDGMREYISNGWVERAIQPGTVAAEWYLPHHPVIRHDKTTTKCRIVFDGSARYKGIALNDLLEPGPPLQTDLVGILLRFRRFKVAVQADIEKMFMQILLHEEDRDFVRFLWRGFKRDLMPTVWRFTRVCFGLTCSPFLAIAVVNKHAEEGAVLYREGAAAVKQNMYVDDLVNSYRTLEEATTVSEQARNLMKAGGFDLKKWTSNCNEAVVSFREEKEEDHATTVMTLGVAWQVADDTLSLRELRLDPSLRDTKRSLLKCAARIFDPLGFIAPFTVVAKVLLQALWKNKVEWDAEMPPNLKRRWLKWKADVCLITEIRIPRWVSMGASSTAETVELHVYCDASQTAYGAVVYLKVISLSNGSSAKLIMSKSRVAPTKQLTMPRLELLAALLGARLVHFVRKELDVVGIRVVCWSDSTVVLSWIRGSPVDWKQFVSNRISEIQSLTEPAWWRYCPTADNPADLLSRGCSLKRLRSLNLWWQGPSWLLGPEGMWPMENKDATTEDVSYERGKTILVNVLQEGEDFGRLASERFADFEKLVRITALCLRFLHNARRRSVDRQCGELSVEEILLAEHVWYIIVQRKHFGAEIERLRAGKPLRSDSRIRQFDPFMGNDDLLRVGGRNTRSHLDYEARHQVLLPHNDHFVTLLLRHLHERKLHAPTEVTLAAVRQRFWITKGRSAVKRVVRNCVVCRKIHSVAFNPKMAELPEGRVTEASPFQRSGVDFAGPLFVRRGRRPAKVYVCLFTCMVTRAIHLELVQNLTTQDFLLAFRRFVARRGRPDYMQSDNFRSFRAADRELNELFNRETRASMKRELSKDRIVWTFITPRSPWSGGYWERLVGSVKTALKKALGHAYVNEQQLGTILCEIEAQINARPLTFLSADPKDMECLTPFHFLTGKAYRHMPQPTSSSSTSQQLSGNELRRKWGAQKAAMAQFWKRWRTEYLASLSGRSKWKATRDGPHVGDVVLIEEDNVRRQFWKLGRIEECQAGSDNVVRSVKVRTVDGVVTRPTRKLHLIEPA